MSINKSFNIHAVTTLPNTGSEGDMYLLQKSNSRLNNSSQYKGVSKHKRDGVYYSKIHYNGKALHLGAFNNEEEAGRAYDKKALELFGEFSYLNFPDLKDEYIKQNKNI